MKQTDKQFMALAGHSIFMRDATGALSKLRVFEFIYNGTYRMLRISPGCEGNYEPIIVAEHELEDKGYIMVSDSLIKPMRDIEGDFVSINV